jgi:glycerol-3-phosphate cytidylyltransferase
VRILTLGTFDLYHAGHVALLRRCRALAGSDGQVIVGLNTDSFVERFKGRPPVVGYADREACLAACRYVDAVLPNDQPDGSIRGLLDVAKPDVIAIGAVAAGRDAVPSSSDWRSRDYLAQLGITATDLASSALVIAWLPYSEGISSSAIRAATVDR